MRGPNFLKGALVAFSILAMAGIVLGQAQSGNIYGKVVADDGSSLPGAAVSLTGGGAPQSFTTDSRGEFRFLNLAPGDFYNIKVELSGFSSVDEKSVVVNLGKNTDVRVVMKLSKVEAAVTVSGEAPLLDTKKVGTGATISRVEMDMIPSARDPWVVMQTVPGVQIDRLNVGGNQSGQQSIFMAKGSHTTQGTWNLDGMTLSDMASGASSPTYWDFDSFQELQAVTGGTDVSVATSGVTLNMVTKRGTDEVHGSARVFITDPAWQAHPTITQEEAAQGAAGQAFVGESIRGVQDYGIEIGGPILKDRLWLWGAYGRDEINLQTVTGFPDKTTLDAVNAKLNFQVVQSNALTGFYSRDNKTKLGRNAATNRPPETTWDQTGPTGIYKIEDNQVFSPNLIGDAFYSYMDEGFQLVPEGGLAKQTFEDTGAIFHNSYVDEHFKRPQHQVLGSLNYFFTTGSLGHEVKFGASYRDTPIRSLVDWPGGELIAFQGPVNGKGGSGACSVDCGAITRNSNSRFDNQYTAIYGSDTLTADRLTVSLGLRYDHQTGSVQAASVAANPLYPTILPGANAPDIANVVKWNDFSPRLGATYAIGDDRKTLARLSYARYANQLGTLASQIAAIPGVAYAYYPWTDTNGNHLIDPGELNTTGAAIKTVNFNPANPSSPVSVNSIDPNLSSEKTDEVVLGIGHELLPNFSVDLAYTYRHYSNLFFDYRTGLTQASYALDHTITGTLPDGTPYSAPVYSIIGGKAAVPPGFFYTNRPDYYQTFNGLEMTMTKRLSGGWMMRGSLAYNNDKQHVGPGACVDPTNSQYSSGEDYVPGGCENNGIVAPNAGAGSGSFGNVNLNSTWQFNFNGAYQLPLGFTVGGNYYGRQGYPIAYYFIDTASNDKQSRRVYVTAIDAERYGWVSQLDLRLDKNIPITSTISATLAIDCFNVLNLNTVTQRNSRLGLSSTATGTNTVAETQAPRILRFSGRISF